LIYSYPRKQEDVGSKPLFSRRLAFAHCVFFRFKVSLEATPPNADDVIMIRSPMNKTSSVTFKLTNIAKRAAPFKAYFTPESDSEFTVIPKTGLLSKHGQ